MIESAYAKAFQKSFKEGQKQDFIALIEQLTEWNNAFQAPGIKKFFLSPAISLQDKKQVLKSLFDSLNQNPPGEVHKSPINESPTKEKSPTKDNPTTALLSSFLYLLLDNHRWSYLSAILGQLNKLKESTLGVLTAEVESAHPLTDDLKQKITHQLEQFFKKKVLLKEQITPKLLGGIKVRAQGFVFDDTLLFHLKRMETQLTGG